MSGNQTRFDGLADFYDRFRPGFPDAAFEALVARAPAGVPRLAVDVGAGVGLSACGLLRATPEDWTVLAVEPGADMRARCAERLAGERRARVEDGSAEALGLPDGSAAIVLAARALHWFDRPAFYAEARRVLASGGVMASLFNRLRPGSAPMMAIEAFFDAEGARETKRVSSDFDTFAALREAEGFGEPERVETPWTLALDTEGLIGLFLTRSTLRPVVERLGLAPVKARMRAIVAEAAPGAASHPLEYDAILAICRKLA